MIEAASAGYRSSSELDRPPKGFRRSPFFGAADGGRPEPGAFPVPRLPVPALVLPPAVRRFRPCLPPFTSRLPLG